MIQAWLQLQEWFIFNAACCWQQDRTSEPRPSLDTQVEDLRDRRTLSKCGGLLSKPLSQSRDQVEAPPLLCISHRVVSESPFHLAARNVHHRHLLDQTKVVVLVVRTQQGQEPQQESVCCPNSPAPRLRAIALGSQAFRPMPSSFVPRQAPAHQILCKPRTGPASWLALRKRLRPEPSLPQTFRNLGRCVASRELLLLYVVPTIAVKPTLRLRPASPSNYPFGHSDHVVGCCTGLHES
mmetsp:Transcript_44111/g.94574  ORF Transcript_44111/g.94574 Transcript_44111/m.94574 type:complete len:238 (-) Transcript_44111:200-913(-)